MYINGCLGLRIIKLRLRGPGSKRKKKAVSSVESMQEQEKKRAATQEYRRTTWKTHTGGEKSGELCAIPCPPTKKMDSYFLKKTERRVKSMQSKVVVNSRIDPVVMRESRGNGETT